MTRRRKTAGGDAQALLQVRAQPVTRPALVAAVGDSDLTGLAGQSVRESVAVVADWPARRLAEALGAADGAPRSPRLRLAVQHVAGRHGTVDLVLVTTRQDPAHHDDTWAIAEQLQRAAAVADYPRWLARIGDIVTVELREARQLATILDQLERGLAPILAARARCVLAHGGGTPSIALCTLMTVVAQASKPHQPCEVVSVIERSDGACELVSKRVSVAIGSGRALLAPGLRIAIDRAIVRRDPAAAVTLARALEAALGLRAQDSVRFEAAAILHRREVRDIRLRGLLAHAGPATGVDWIADALAHGRQRDVGVVLLAANALGVLRIDDQRTFADLGYRLMCEAGDLLAHRHGLTVDAPTDRHGRYLLDGDQRGKLWRALGQLDRGAADALMFMDSHGLDTIRNQRHHLSTDSGRDRVQHPDDVATWSETIGTVLDRLDLPRLDPVSELLASTAIGSDQAQTPTGGRTIAVMMLGGVAISVPPPRAARSEIEVIERAAPSDVELRECLPLTLVRNALTGVPAIDELWLVGTDQPTSEPRRVRDTGPLALLVERRWTAWRSGADWPNCPRTVRAVVPPDTPMTATGPALATLARDAASTAGKAGCVVLIDAIGPKEMRLPIALDLLAAADETGCRVVAVGSLEAGDRPIDLGLAIGELRALTALRLGTGALAERRDAIALLDVQRLEGPGLRTTADRLHAGLAPHPDSLRAAQSELAPGTASDEPLLEFLRALHHTDRTRLQVELALHDAWRARATDLATACAAIDRAVEGLELLDPSSASIRLSKRYRDLRNELAHAPTAMAPTDAEIAVLTSDVPNALGINHDTPWIEVLDRRGHGIVHREDPAEQFVRLLVERAIRVLARQA